MLRRQVMSPLERRVLALRDAGETDESIARRFKRSPEFIGRVARLSELRRGGGRDFGRRPGDAGLRPLERRVLRWRGQGASHDELAGKFGRSAGHLARVERLARYKLRRAGVGG
jgi:DNA-binding CsgD family transcriptional regulator